MIEENNPVSRRMMTPREAAIEAGLSPATVYNLIEAGIIPSVRFGRSVRIPLDGWEEFLATGGKAFDNGWRKEEIPVPIVRKSGRR